MNYPSKIKLRDMTNCRDRQVGKIRDRIPKVLKFYHGWNGIEQYTKSTARRWLNGDNH